MSANTPPTFGLLGKFPTEIRRMIFTYMIQDTTESYMEPPDYGVGVLSNENQTQGLDASNARKHLTNSPWITLNKQYCAEYLQIFVKEAELRKRYRSRSRRLWTHIPSYSNSVTEPKQLAELNNVLKLITQRFDIAGPYAGTEMSRKMLVSRIKGICLSYHYRGSYFERGFGKTERREYPCDGFLENPMRHLRQLHEDYNIPSNRLSISISYGDPSWTILACLGLPSSSDAPKYVASLRAVRVRIQVDDYDASVIAIDKELEVLKKALGAVIRDIHIAFPEPDRFTDFLELEHMTDRDMVLLRRDHLRAIDQVTKFWKAPCHGGEADDTPKNMED